MRHPKAPVSSHAVSKIPAHITKQLARLNIDQWRTKIALANLCNHAFLFDQIAAAAEAAQQER